jgi:hypothetical protein
VSALNVWVRSMRAVPLASLHEETARPTQRHGQVCSGLERTSAFPKTASKYFTRNNLNLALTSKMNAKGSRQKTDNGVR